MVYTSQQTRNFLRIEQSVSFVIILKTLKTNIFESLKEINNAEFTPVEKLSEKKYFALFLFRFPLFIERLSYIFAESPYFISFYFIKGLFSCK